MSENDTSVLNSTYINSTSSPDTGRLTPRQCVDIAVFALSTITFAIGIASWILINKFRHFKNYLFLNIILNNVLNIVLGFFVQEVMKIGIVWTQVSFGLTFLYFKMTSHFWLLVLCYVFYVDVVKVFSGEVKRKYLKSVLFCWGLPLIIIVFDVFIMPHINSSLKVPAIIYISKLFFPLFINLLIYIRVLYALFMNNFPHNRFRRFQVATIIFLISGTLFLVMTLRFTVKFPSILSTVLIYLQPVLMDLYFFLIRSNRKVWKKYYERKIKSTLIPLIVKSPK